MKKIYFLYVVLLLAACSKSDNNAGESDLRAASTAANLKTADSDPGQSISEAIREHKLYLYPEVTINIMAKDIQRALRLIKAAEGKVVYDPNFGSGSTIPFAIIQLSAAKALDKKFFDSLELQKAQLGIQEIVALDPNLGTEKRDWFIPNAEVNIPELRQRGQALGQNTTIAVVDTGIDAFHPAFQDRVIYWADHTQETRTRLNLLKDPAQLAVLSAFQKDQEVYSGKISEAALGAQLGDSERLEKDAGIDLNGNNSRKDEFNVYVGKLPSGIWTAVVDANGDGKLSADEAALIIGDFNEVRGQSCRNPVIAAKGLRDYVLFASHSRQIKYPLLIEKSSDGKPQFVSLGLDLRSHGTHVAGIAAGNWDEIKGSAPEAKIMSLKVCSGISCTESAINRALVDTFFNASGCVPDVVNMSLGSHEKMEDRATNWLIRDMIAKFGAAFVISASNNGPGFRSLNGIGSIGAAMHVGASASKETLVRHYNTRPDDSTVPDHSVFGFSSLGPSYTAALRPNFVAPGSAFSSTPTAIFGANMMNGTSMSAPLASGAIAAMLSLAKQSPEWKKFAPKLEQKIKANLARTSLPDIYSLTGYAIALRGALEQGATSLLNHVDPQQGFGLLNVDAAYPIFLRRLNALDQDLSIFFDLKIGTEAKAAAKYLRGIDLVSRQEFPLSVRDDGEMSELDLIRMRKRDYLVRLDYVQALDPQGKVEKIMSGNMPFSILLPGAAEQNARSAVVAIGNPIASSFFSLRKFSRMQPGYTYIAHYGVYVGEERLQSINDIVHMPLQFPEEKRELDLQAISPNRFDKRAVLGFKNIEISSNQVHRYFIAVTERDQIISFRLAPLANRNGALVATLYDSKGAQVATATAIRRPDQAGAALAVSQAIVEAPGIYELTVGANGARWMSDSSYDLLIEAQRIKVSHQELAIKAGEEKFFTVMLSPGQFKKVSVELVGDRQITRYKDIKVESGKISYRRILLPEGLDPKAITTIQLRFDKKFVDSDDYAGRIDHQLYTLSADGKDFIPLTAKLAADSSSSSRVFEDIKWDKPIYFALETYEYRPTDKLAGAEMEIHFLQARPGTKNISVEQIPNAGKEIGVYKLRVAPDYKASAIGMIKITADQDEKTTVAIPVQVNY